MKPAVKSCGVIRKTRPRPPHVRPAPGPVQMTARVIPREGTAHARWYTCRGLRFSGSAAELVLSGWADNGMTRVEVAVSTEDMMRAFEAWKASR